MWRLDVPDRMTADGAYRISGSRDTLFPDNAQAEGNGVL